MRYLVTATMAASVLAIGLTTEPAVSLPLGGKASAPDAVIQKVQRQEKGRPAATGPGVNRYGYGPRKMQRGDRLYFSGTRGGVATCGSLRRRALHTGSSRWWHRYQACRAGLGG